MQDRVRCLPGAPGQHGAKGANNARNLALLSFDFDLFPQLKPAGANMISHGGGYSLRNDTTKLTVVSDGILVLGTPSPTTLWVHWQFGQTVPLVPVQTSIGLLLDGVLVAGSLVPMLSAAVSGSFMVRAKAGQLLTLVNLGPDTIDLPDGGLIQFSAIRLQ